MPFWVDMWQDARRVDSYLGVGAKTPPLKNEISNENLASESQVLEGGAIVGEVDQDGVDSILLRSIASFGELFLRLYKK